VKSTGLPSDTPPPLVLAIGQFDGVHIGHRAVFRAAIDSAQDRMGVAGCLTFYPHIAQLLDPNHAPLLLATPDQNERHILACGIQVIHTLPFSRELAAMEPGDFLSLLRLEFPTLAEVVVGHNFTFGRHRSGTTQTLPRLAHTAGLQARIVPHVERDGAPISSTRIRHAVTAGNLDLARAMLGRPFALAGRIIRGRAVGRTIGFPTANLQPDLPIRPPPGIYAARLHLSDGSHAGAAFLPDPSAPAQAHFGDVVEIHVPELDRDLYDQEVEVSFTQFIRAYMPFPTLAAASQQIARDVHAALLADRTSQET